MNTPLLLLLLLPVNHARSQPAQYDQRQEGKVNVQIHVKDVQVLALVDGDAIDDYIVSTPMIIHLLSLRL